MKWNYFMEEISAASLGCPAIEDAVFFNLKTGERLFSIPVKSWDYHSDPTAEYGIEIKNFENFKSSIKLTNPDIEFVEHKDKRVKSE